MHIDNLAFTTKGEINMKSKNSLYSKILNVSEDPISYFKSLRKEGKTYKDIAEQFGVNSMTPYHFYTKYIKEQK